MESRHQLPFFNISF